MHLGSERLAEEGLGSIGVVMEVRGCIEMRAHRNRTWPARRGFPPPTDVPKGGLR